MGERLHASHLLENFILFASLGLCIFVLAQTAYFLILTSPRPMSNAFPKIVVLPDRGGNSPAGRCSNCAGARENQRPADVFSPPERRGGGKKQGKYWKRRKKSVDILKLLIIIGASMIEARTSRVRLPKGSGTGEGERGFRRGFALPPEGAGAGPRGKHPPDCHLPGGGALSWIHTKCVGYEVMTSCHDFILF